MADNEETRELTVSSALRGLRLIILFIVGIIAVVLIYFNLDQFNIDSFKRLFARLDITFSTGNASDGEIYFSSGIDNVFAFYKDGPAVISKEGLTVYDSNCNPLSTTAKIYKHPTGSVSKKYILSYDRGERSISLSNSFSTVFQKDFDGGVIGATVNDSGRIAVVSETPGYKSLVTVFDSKFKMQSELYFSDKYVVKAAVSSDNNNVALISLRGNKSNVDTVLSIYKIGDEAPAYEAVIADDIAFDMNYKIGGGLEIITPKAAYYYSKGGKLITTVNFTGGKIYSYSFGDDSHTCFVCACESSDNANHIIVTDEKGNIKMSAESPDIVADTAFCGGGLAMLSGGNLKVCKIQKDATVLSGRAFEVDNDVQHILGNANTVYLFTESSARALKIS